MVLVGPSQLSFKVPQDLLIRWSPPLGEMCRSGLKESQTRIIPLPHIKISTFEDFFIWMHACEPKVQLKSLAPVLDLAIFAEMYIVCQLKNQTSDILRTELSSGRWQLTPDDVCMVYNEVPPGSVLRKLCSSSLAIPVPKSSSSLTYGYLNAPSSTHRKYDNYLEWQFVFEKHSDLGWEYFRRIQAGHSKTVDANWGGPCRFHDHRDIPEARRDDVVKCPYPHGALPNEHQHGVSTDAQHVENGIGEEQNFGLEGPLDAEGEAQLTEGPSLPNEKL